LRRGCDQYGISIDYRPVRTPHYGGHIERLIGTLMGKVHLLPGTTFSDIRSKGNMDPEKTAAMTLEEIDRWIGHAIAGVYHQDLHRAISTTPLAAWQAGLEATRNTAHCPRPVPDPKRFLLDFLPLQRRQIRREGVRLNSIWYWSDVLRTLIGHREKLILRYDPRDLSRLYLLAPDGNYYDLNYADLRRPVISLREHRLALKRVREHGRAAVNEEAIFRAVESMRGIADRATAQTKALRRQRERRRSIEPIADSSSIHSAGSTAAFVPQPEGTELFKVEEWS
jgi:putative transposase